jgi:hypothetical protein
VLFTTPQSLQLTRIRFPRSVVDVTERLQSTVDKINFERFAASISGPVQSSLISAQQEINSTLTDEYENILKTLRNMMTVMEQFPRAFESMSEEHLRAHFLVQLNGVYAGTATGETFNFQGRTDILIKKKGRNAFVAECKFWRGEQSFLDCINQHLSYLTWHDTRSAILIFNRNRNLSDVLKKIGSAVPTHKLFRAELGKMDETSFRYKFSHPTDPMRECLITVLVFDIPVA